jgi:selenocysteine lyase/cysteine desulfurase
MSSTQRLIETVRQSIIGASEVLESPYGPRRVTYADYTASGRCLSFIEKYLLEEVLPTYANTHTEASATGRTTTHLREQAREIIHDAVGGEEEDIVLFCGSGATGSIDRLVRCLNISLPFDLNKKYNLIDEIPVNDRPVIFIGPFEHHSNELPWRESIADVVTIPEDEDGLICQKSLTDKLIEYADRPLKIGSFSAASNVTGIGSKTAEIAILLHRYGALSFWDYAAAGPYVQIEMNLKVPGPDGHLAYKDAIFLSPHKFIGGPGTPGVLVAKRHIFVNAVPAVPGGGTVAYVNPKEHTYLKQIEHREEGGTPDIIGSIRAGLVFQLKEAIGHKEIYKREHAFIQRAITSWGKEANIQILGNSDRWRLSIVSFVVRDGPQMYLHHNFVVALLNDLFGIQSRGGCSCAGPYGHRLLGIDLDTSYAFQREIIKGSEGIKPGWVRVNFNYFLADQEAEFIIRAVRWVAEHGHKLLCEYTFAPLSGLWIHREGIPRHKNSLQDISYRRGLMEYPSRHATEPAWMIERYFDMADAIVAQVDARDLPHAVIDPERSEDFESLRWFSLPGDGQRSA